MFGLFLVTAFAQISPIVGYDHFGRRCALERAPVLAVEVEDEWYDRLGAVTRDPGRLGEVVTFATVRARDGESIGSLEIRERHGRPIWFRLWLDSATGYAHVCTLDHPPKRALF